MLVCNNLACNYGHRRVFENVSFTADKGTFIVLHGHNGTGKTSLLHILAGLKIPHGGEIAWEGEAMGRAITNGNLSVTYIGHELPVKPEMSVIENIHFWADLNGDRQSVPFALKKFGLDRYQNTKCSDLSKGWQKRVALARLIFCPADMWILDEPYNNLDHEVSRLLDSLISEKIGVGGIVILSSHLYVPIESAVKINISDFAPKVAA